MTASAARMPIRATSAGRARALHGVLQIVGGLAVWGLYLLITHGITADRGQADGRGNALLDAERWLHVDVERAADHWLARHDTVLGWLAAWEYATTYIVTTFVVLAWLWWRRPADYPWGRNTLVWSTVIAIVCFAVWPTTPPRLLPGSGFFDIVAAHHPILSWGGGTVSASADQFAAMPSLHVGWAVWVTAVTLRAGAGRVGYLLAVLHLAVTALVVVATGNHYVLDVVAGFVLVRLAIAIERARGALAGTATGRGQRVAAPDEFFLHVETGRVQQPVGGFVMLDRSRADGPLDLDRVRALVAERLPRMPRFRQQLRPAGWWRHARWVDAEPDLDWHVQEHVLPGAGGRAALADFVSGLAEIELDRDRPMWRLYFVPNTGPDEAMALAIMHHAFADGLGVVDILRQLFDPELPAPDLSQFRRPALPVRLAAGGLGLLQLAADGSADRLPFAEPLSGRRRYRIGLTDFDGVREVARRTGTKMTDVLLAATGCAVADVLARRGTPTVGRRLRAAVPVTTRLPAPPGTGRSAEPGNLTAALRLDVPLDPELSPLQRLARTAAAAEPRRRSGRALATTAVMRVVGLLPPPLHRRVARAMYQRRYFTAIVSNMPGPTAELSMAGAPIKDVYPILPLAEGVPLGVGTLGWAGQFCLSVITDAQRLPEADALVTGILQAIERMRLELPELPEQPELPGEAAADGGSDARAGGVREEVPTSPS